MPEVLTTEEIIELGNEGAPQEWLDHLTGKGPEGAPEEELQKLIKQAEALNLAESLVDTQQIQADYAFKYHQCSAANYTAGRGGNRITHIVIHYTAGSVTAAGAAYANCQYFANGSRGASAHYFVDDGYTIWQSVNLNDTAWHAGNWSMNQRSIGIEVCTAGDFTNAEIDRVAFLVQHLMAQYNIPSQNVIRHYDVTGKHCPAAYVDWNKWAWLHNQIMTRGKIVSEANDVRLWSGNISDKHIWIKRDYDKNGKRTTDPAKYAYSTLQNLRSKKYLDVKDGIAKSKQPVRSYPGNNTDAQKFICEVHQFMHDAYIKLKSKLNPKLVVDVANGSTADGAGLWLYANSPEGNLAQQMVLVFAGYYKDSPCYFIENQGSGKHVAE